MLHSTLVCYGDFAKCFSVCSFVGLVEPQILQPTLLLNWLFFIVCIFPLIGIIFHLLWQLLVRKITMSVPSFLSNGLKFIQKGKKSQWVVLQYYCYNTLVCSILFFLMVLATQYSGLLRLASVELAYIIKIILMQQIVIIFSQLLKC